MLGYVVFLWEEEGYVGSGGLLLRLVCTPALWNHQDPSIFVANL